MCQMKSLTPAQAHTKQRVCAHTYAAPARLRDCQEEEKWSIDYTLSHPENDRDVTERAQRYTLQEASLMRQSPCSFLNA